MDKKEYRIASVTDEQLERIRKAEKEVKKDEREIVLIAYEKDDTCR